MEDRIQQLEDRLTQQSRLIGVLILSLIFLVIYSIVRPAPADSEPTIIETSAEPPDHLVLKSLVVGDHIKIDASGLVIEDSTGAVATFAAGSAQFKKGSNTISVDSSSDSGPWIRLSSGTTTSVSLGYDESGAGMKASSHGHAKGLQGLAFFGLDSPGTPAQRLLDGKGATTTIVGSSVHLKAGTGECTITAGEQSALHLTSQGRQDVLLSADSSKTLLAMTSGPALMTATCAGQGPEPLAESTFEVSGKGNPSTSIGIRGPSPLWEQNCGVHTAKMSTVTDGAVLSFTNSATKARCLLGQTATKGRILFVDGDDKETGRLPELID